MRTMRRTMHARTLPLLSAALALALLAALLLAASAPGAGHQGRAAAKPGKPAAKAPTGTITTAKPTFIWSKAPRATTYEVRVYNGKTLVLKKTGIKRCSWKSSRALPTNVGLSWMVRARNGAGNGGWGKSLKWIYGEKIPPGQIAYVHTDYSLDASQGQDEVWLMESDGSPARRICGYLGDVVDLQWSPDGGRLAVVTQNPDQPQRLWTMAADGSDLLQIHPSFPSADSIDDQSGTIGGLAWSPSGDRIALTYAVHNASWDAIASWVLAVDPATNNVTSLAGPTDEIAYHELAWAPNGSEFVASSTSVITESGWLSRIDAGTGADLGTLVGPEYFEYWQDPAFSPDGRWIASAVSNIAALITDQGTVTYGITLVSKGGATRRVISKSKTLFWGNPSWSPNGRWVVADRGPRDATHIVLCRTSVRGPAVDTGVDGEQPVWRPGTQAAAEESTVQ